jgi:hypothetical protein
MTGEYGEERDDKGKFKPGNRAGSGRGPNKVSGKVRDSIVKFLEDNVDAIQESFDELKPKEKLEFVSSILSYAVPKLSSTQIDAEVNAGITIRFETPGDYIYPAQDQSDSGIPESI